MQNEYETPAPEFKPAASDEPAAVLPQISAVDVAEAAAGVDAAFAEINAQPKAKIRVPQVFGPQVVIINGARFNVPCGIFVEVPQQVADMLADSGRI